MRVRLIYVLFVSLSMIAFAGSAHAFDRVIIDPGHGGYESGFTADNIKEKDVTLMIARKLEQAVELAGKDALLTRKVDQSLSLSERIAKTEEFNGDLLISIHAVKEGPITINAAPFDSSKAGMAEFYRISRRHTYYASSSRELARHIGTAMKKIYGYDARYREVPSGLLMRIGAPALLIELPLTGLDYSDDDVLDQAALAIIQGIIDYEQR